MLTDQLRETALSSSTRRPSPGRRPAAGMRGSRLPTFAQLADPDADPAARSRAARRGRPRRAAPAQPLPRPLVQRRRATGVAPRCPEHVVLPPELTGVDAHDRRRARRPLPDDRRAQGARRLRLPRAAARHRRSSIPTRQRAVWPSTGNYCRGGVAISRILGLPRRRRPAGGHEPRALRLARAVGRRSRRHHPHARHREQRQGDLRPLRTSSTRDPENVIFNQFAEFGNYLVHYLATGRALERVFESLAAERARGSRLRAFVSATGSAGTIAAGDYLKERLGSLIVAVEALECPTLLENGFGEHNIQGIGDKHVPLIHNVMNTDVVARGLRPRDRPARRALRHRGGPALPRAAGAACRDAVLDELRARSGSRASATSLAAIKTAKHFDLGPDDVVVTVATDGAAHVRQRARARAARRTSAAASTRSRRRGLRRAPARRDDRPPARADAARSASASSTSATSPGSSSRASRSRTSRRAATQSFWDGLRALAAALGRADRRVQRPHGRARGMSCDRHPARDAARLRRLRRDARRRRDPYPFRCPNAGAVDDVDHVLRRELDPTRGRAGRGATSRTRSSATATLLHAYHDARRAHRRRVLRARPRPRRRASRPSTATASRVTPFARADELARRSASRRRRRLGEGRDRQRRRLAQGPPPLGRADLARGR